MDPRPDDPTTIISSASTSPPSPPPAEPAADVANGAGHEPAATEAVAAVTGSGISRTRWLVGGGIAVAAVAAVALAAAFLAASPLPEVLKYLPRDSAIVVELRPELPGDQRQQLGNFLAHFPGFEDQSTLSAKLDEALERIVREASGGTVDYATRVKPLMAGPMALGVNADALGSMEAAAAATRVLLVATTDGTATCQSIFDAGGDVTTYRDVELVALGGEITCAVHGRHLLVGTDASVRGGLDARLDGQGVDGNPTYREARSRLDGDQLASVFVDGDPLFAAVQDAAGPFGGAAELPEGFWLIQGLRVLDDALVVDAFTPPIAAVTPSGAPTAPPASESRFATSLPVDTLGYVEFHGVGASVERALAALRAVPDSAEFLQTLDQGLLALGGTANLTGWIEEAGIAVLPTDDALGGAVLLRGTDAAAAAARVSQIRNLLVVGSIGSDITVTDADHDGITITTVDLGDISSLIGGAGIPAPDLPPGTEAAPVEFSFAAREDLVIVGIGDGVVERILDTEAPTSLSTAATYGRVIDVAGATNDLQVFIAVDAVLALVERFLPAEGVDLWATELEPYFEHLGGVAMTSLGASSGSHFRAVLTVK